MTAVTRFVRLGDKVRKLVGLGGTDGLFFLEMNFCEY
jgi:hypothetical protein